MKLVDLTGQRRGKLVVIERGPANGKPYTRWRCRCDCGNETILVAYSLREEGTKSCGCLHREGLSLQNLLHGATRGGKWDKNYRLWSNIKTRCLNPNGPDYLDYGGRGITFHPLWVNDYGAFRDYVLDNLGPCLPGMSLDRINNNGNYEPGNIRWATQSMQTRNSRPRRKTSRHSRSGR